jgi:hypothetical protein
MENRTKPAVMDAFAGHKVPLHEAPKNDAAETIGALRAIRRRVATYPVLDNRDADELLGYDEHGLPRP